jgi:hypothetical protein
MNDQSEEIAKLRNEVEALKQAFGTSLVMLQATHHLALSLAAAHENGARVAEVFDSFAARGDNHLLNSMTSDADLERTQELNAAISKLLRSPH